jgi:hypothetical protein
MNAPQSLKLPEFGAPAAKWAHRELRSQFSGPGNWTILRLFKP